MTTVRLALWPFGLLLVVAAALGVADSPATTYGGTGAGLLGAETCVAVALLVAGALDSSVRRGLLLGVLGLLWLLPELTGWVAGPLPLRTAAAATQPLLLALAATLPLVLVVGTAPRARLVRAAAIGAVCAGVAAAAARLLLVDPFLDPWCWRSCDPNPLQVADGSDAGRWLERGGLLVLLAAMVVAAAVLIASHASPVGFAAVGLVAALVTAAALRLVRPEDPSSGPFVATFALVQAAALAVAVCICWDRYREWRLRVLLTRLAEGVRSSPEPGALAAVLGRAVADPDLRIDYWVPRRQQFVDVDGRSVGSAVGPTRRVTPVARSGQQVARLVHRADIDGDRVDRALGAALRLALENEQLRAATLAELHDLRSSRVRIVDRAADERRRLERNLHDGAQQRVVALSLLARMLRSRAQDSHVVALAGRAEALTRTALEELRRVARGIYPAVLADSGLSGAVLDLAQSSRDVAVVVEHVTPARYPGRVETTAFLVIAAALSDARSRRATSFAVRVATCDRVLVAELCDDAPQRTDHLSRDLADQVGALSGELDVRPTLTGTRVTLGLPCEW